jgi:hypothetical protein
MKSNSPRWSWHTLPVSFHSKLGLQSTRAAIVDPVLRDGGYRATFAHRTNRHRDHFDDDR